MDKKETVTSPLFDGTVSQDVSEEYVLPDYYPEIRRIISVTARALPESRFVGDGVIEFGGTVTFIVLYVGESGEIASVPYAFAYSGNTAVPKSDAVSSVSVVTKADAVACRVLSPRKICLRARLKSHILALTSLSTSVKLTDVSGRVAPSELMSIERKTASVPSTERALYQTTGEASGVIRCDGEAKLISCDGSAVITSATASDSRINVVGEAEITALCEIDGKYVTLRAKTPIDEAIPADVAKSGMPVTASALPASASVQNDGDKYSLRYEIEYDISAELAMPYDAEITEDMYSSSSHLAVISTDADSLSPFCYGIITVSADGSCEAPTGEVIARCADVSVDKVEIVGDKLTVAGTATVHAIIGDELAKADVSMPYRAELRSVNGLAGKPVGNVTATVASSTARNESGKLTCTAEITVSAAVMSDCALRFVTSAELDKTKKTAHSDGKIIVYYATPDETAWDVAKKYAVPLSGVDGDGNVYVI